MNKPVREGFVVEEDTKLKAAPPPHMENPPEEIEVKKEKWPITVRLMHKNIMDNQGAQIDRLEFRQPRGGDINRYGNPCRVNQDGDVVIDERKMHYVMSALCGVLPPLLEELDPRDWNSCAYRLRDFFLPDLRGWQ
jgi:hypothetical protein